MKALTALLLSAAVFTAVPAFAADETAGWQDNKPQSLESLKAPVRVVNLWATWCGPCRKEMPAMSAWYKAQKKGSVDMVGIALDTTDNIGKFLKQTPVSYPIWRYTGANSRNFMKAHGNNRRRIAFHCRRSAEMRLQTNHHRRSQRKKPDRRREFGQNQM